LANEKKLGYESSLQEARKRLKALKSKRLFEEIDDPVIPA